MAALAAALILLGGMGCPCRAEAPGGEAEQFEPLGSLLHTNFARIDSVIQEPAVPGAVPVAVTARVSFENGNADGAKIENALLFVSLDGLPYRPQEMREAAPSEFTAQISPQPLGTKVSYYIQLTDSYGNVTTEAPGKTDWKNALETMAEGAAYSENPIPNVVPDDMFALQTRIGYDSRWIYVYYDVAGKIVPGTVEPPNIHLYGAKLSNPDAIPNEGVMTGAALFFAPMVRTLKMMDPNAEALFPEIALFDMSKILGGGPEESQVPGANPEYKILNGSALLGRVRRAALGDNPSGYVRFTALTIALGSTEEILPVPTQSTPYTIFYARTHEYDVK